MPNHVHLFVYTNSEQTIDKIIGNGKRFMAYEIVERLEKLGRGDLLKLMSVRLVRQKGTETKSMKCLRLLLIVKK